MDACWVSQWMFYVVLNAVSDDVFLKKYVIGNGVYFIQHLKKNTEKIVLLEVKGLIQVTVKFRTENSVSITKHPF